MEFLSLPFLLFLAAFLLLYHNVKGLKQQWLVMLLGSFVFYGFWDWRFLLLLEGLVLLCWLCAGQYGRTGKNFFIVFPTVCCVAALGIFKYLGFFVSSFCAAFRISRPGALNIILPLGISFYLFQLMSYLFDVKGGKVSPEQTGLLRLSAYVSFFPQITSGPIVKARDFLPQMETLHRIRRDNVYAGLQLVLVGATKKLVFADRIGVAVNAVYAVPEAYSGLSVFAAVICYAMQIYFDFSGYSDMAIGVARILDFDLGKNFDLPYLSQNISEFWSRWHMSLSSWFKEYVYIPLGGSRRGSFRTCRNLFLTMLLSGLWHGANWTYLVWGAVHGLWSTGSAWLRRHRPDRKSVSGLRTLGRILITDLLFALTLVIFRAESLSHALRILCSLFNTTGIFYINVYAAVFLVILVAVHVLAWFKNSGHTAQPGLNLDTFRGRLALSVWIFLIAMFMYVGDSAFIYANF